MKFNGPGTPFELLFEEAAPSSGLGLPPELRDVYSGDWVIPATDQYRYSNFVISRDGKTSFSIHGHEGGGDISGFNRNDQWIMALARARADAVTVGANTLRLESEHIWSAEFIFPDEAAGFAALRVAEGRRKFPYQVMVTRSGDVNGEAAIFRDPELEVIIATTTSGAQRVRAAGIDGAIILELGADDVDLVRLHEVLRSKYGVKSLLCEGGPKFYGAMIAARQIDEEFLTSSPVLVGGAASEYRPGLIDGIALRPGNDLGGHLASVRRSGEMLFLRTKYRR